MVGWRRLDKVWKCQLIEIWALIKTATGMPQYTAASRLAQTVEHETLNLRVVCSSPTLGVSIGFLSLPNSLSVSSESLYLSLLMQETWGVSTAWHCYFCLHTPEECMSLCWWFEPTQGRRKLFPAAPPCVRKLQNLTYEAPVH